MDTTVIVGGVRTAIGRLSGTLATLSTVELGGHVITAAIARSGIDLDTVDHVVMGQVLQAGAGQNPARQAAVRAGISMDVPALTVNRVCLSGMTAIAYADQLIRVGEANVVVAGGQESMTNAPHVLPGSRAGYRYGSIEVLDAMAHDGLTDAFDHLSMGASTESHNGRLGLTRHTQDAYAAASHQRAQRAQAAGILGAEIIPLAVASGRGQSRTVDSDEGIRVGTTVESLGHLRPAFAPEGTITAGSSSQISDGAAAVIVMSRHLAEKLDIPWLAEIVGHATVAGPDNSLHSQPANAINAALTRTKMSIDDLDLFEINEAFAAVAVRSTQVLGVDPDRVNVNGGAIAFGHPIGMSGARLPLTLALELRRRGGGLGVAALCGGGGQGEALILSVPA